MNYPNDFQMNHPQTGPYVAPNQYNPNQMYVNNPNSVSYIASTVNQQPLIPHENYNPNPYPVTNISPPIVNNQTTPPEYEVQNLRCALRSSSQFISCPYCKNQGLTRTEQQCSCPNILCCVCFGGLPWLLFQACRGKDINCYDSTHYCIRCNALLANYQAC